MLLDAEKKIREIEEEIARTQIHKGTEHHIGLLKAKIARLRREMQEKKKGPRTAQTIKRAGDATVVLVGMRNSGKTALFRSLLSLNPFESLKPSTEPRQGIMVYKGAEIQLIDTPGIVPSTNEKDCTTSLASARMSDLLLLVIDACNKGEEKKLREELTNANIRVGEKAPDIQLTKTHRGGIIVSSTVKLTLPKQKIISILLENRIHNANLLFREDISEERFRDFLAGNRAYVPAITVYTKSDMINTGTTAGMHVSALTGQNIPELKESIFKQLNLIRVYPKPKLGEPNFEKPLILKAGMTVADVCERIHKDLKKDFWYALISGPSALFDGQKVGLNHQLKDGDIITIITKK